MWFVRCDCNCNCVSGVCWDSIGVQTKRKRKESNKNQKRGKGAEGVKIETKKGETKQSNKEE